MCRKRPSKSPHAEAHRGFSVYMFKFLRESQRCFEAASEMDGRI